jgi:calcium-dependent protein kinase
MMQFRVSVLLVVILVLIATVRTSTFEEEVHGTVCHWLSLLQHSKEYVNGRSASSSLANVDDVNAQLSVSGARRNARKDTLEDILNIDSEGAVRASSESKTLPIVAWCLIGGLVLLCCIFLCRFLLISSDETTLEPTSVDVSEKPVRAARLSVDAKAEVSSPEAVKKIEGFEKIKAIPRASRGMSKAVLVPHHASSDFVEKHYDVGAELGSGAFGYVRSAIDRKTGQERVCKFVSTKGLEPQVLKMMKDEVALLCLLDHPGVVTIFEYAFDASKLEVVFVMECLRGGDCCSLLERADGKPLCEPLVATITYQALTALCYCHSRDVVHRDVKPENIMLVEAIDIDSTTANCKLIDFGLSLTREAPMHGNLYGTAQYMAPEKATLAMAKKRREVEDFMPQADVWSLGIAAFELLFDECPFHNIDKKVVFKALSQYSGYRKIENKFIHLPIWRQRSVDSHNFLRAILVADPEKRPSCEEALMHSWLAAHRGNRDSLGSEMCRSLTGYQKSPEVVRCCLYVIAARLGASDQQRFGATFLRLDKDGDGSLTAAELSEGLSEMKGGSSIDVDFILDAVDLDHNGSISFTEFVAACLHARYVTDGSLEPLMKRAFEALDDNRDGLVSHDEVCSLFRERDAPTLRCLPRDRDFDVDEWIRLLQFARSSLPSGFLSPRSALALDRPISPPQVSVKEESLPSGLLSPRSAMTLERPLSPTPSSVQFEKLDFTKITSREKPS